MADDHTKPPNPIMRLVGPSSIIGMIAFLVMGLPQPYYEYAMTGLSVIGILSIIATRIPAPRPGSKLLLPYRILCLLSMNFGEAENADAPPKKGEYDRSSSKGTRVVISDSGAGSPAPDQEKETVMSDSNENSTAKVTPVESLEAGAEHIAESFAPKIEEKVLDGVAEASAGPAKSSVQKESISGLVDSVAALWHTVTGEKTENAVKAFSGVSLLAEAIVPFIDSKTHIRVEDVVSGATDVTDGLTKIATAVKAKQVQA